MRHRSNLGQLQVGEDELTRFRFIFDRDLVAGFHIIGSNVHAAPVHEYVPVRNQLPGGAPRIGQAEAVNDVIESGLEKLEQRFAGYTALTERILENAAELTL